MIGIFGGTFDPIHYGHLRPALDVQQALGLQQVRFIPLAVAVHRGQPAGSAEQRLAMVRAAIAGQPGFVADDREIRRGGHSYTLDTLAEIKRERPDDTLCLFVGDDAFNDFLTWHRPLAILDLAHLVVMSRPGSRRSADENLTRLAAERRCQHPDTLKSRQAGLICFQPVTPLDISATAIRALAGEGRDTRFLLPDAVLEIIRRDQLYRRRKE